MSFQPQQPIRCGPINVEGLRTFLKNEGFSEGMWKIAEESFQKQPIRFFIVDDSGSMNAGDGSQIIVHGHKTMMIPCSRWTELTTSLKFHALLAHYSNAVTEFRLLNAYDPVVVGLPNDPRDGLTQALRIFSTSSPGGATPLCRHIIAVTTQLKLLETQLRANGQRAVLVIATDGESSDGDIIEVLKPLQSLPVWMVIRLCTNDIKIRQYWNNIDKELEIQIDVLDDIKDEAYEIYKYNKWCTYSEQLHHLRECGITLKEIDLLDEKSLSSEEMKVICSILIGNGNAKEIPPPEGDWSLFLHTIQSYLLTAPRVYDPIKNSLQPIINLYELKRQYHPSVCDICVIS